MKNPRQIIAGLCVFVAALLAGAGLAHGQAGGMGMQGPQFSGAMEKLFGDHKAFSATMEFQNEGGAVPGMTIDGKVAVRDGMARFEMDLAGARSSALPQQAIAQMKQMGMDKMVTVSVPDKKVAWMIYPSMKAYVELPVADTAGKTDTDYKMAVTELGSEDAAGHACAKEKVVVTGPDGAAHESTIWAAKDLEKFPVKIEMNEQGSKVTMTFKDVKLDKPDSSLFAAPTDYKKYDNIMNLVMSRMKGHGAQ